MNIVIEEDEEEFQVKRLSSADIQYQESNNERRWRLSYLKDQFESLKLHKLFDRYIQRIRHGYFSQFLSLQIIIVTAHFIILLSFGEGSPHVIPDLVIYGVISLLSIILLIITDFYVKQHPSLLRILSGTAFLVTYFMNFFVPYYHKDKNLRPAYTIYLIISNYIFLNIHNDLLAFLIGLFMSISHLVTLILVTYEEDNEILYRRIASDAIFLISLNCLGVYFRHMNEIVIRRSFLDRRSCIESTHQLKFEEEQENTLMSSIIPQHIIAKVRMALMQHRDNCTNNEFPKEKPFEDLYVEEHPNVSILFADIVNYTAMTTQLDVVELLDILNELFGRFDDASEALKVLRIKFLGDCYYCVSGLPPDPAPYHADACVDLGLKMISIIGDIRKRTKLDINMRIGVHSGKISSGIIGSIKWQFDIWSSDVDIANKMETEGVAGKVHITKATKDLLHKQYDISSSGKQVNDEETFLITSKTDTEVVTNGNINNTPNVENHVEQHNNNNNIINNNASNRRYLKRNSTAPNDLRSSIVNNSVNNNHRSFSLIGNSTGSIEAQNSDINVEDIKNNNLVLGKRHTFPSSNSRRISGSVGVNFPQKRISGNVRFSTERRLTGNDRKRRTAFMNNNIKRYNKMVEETNKELEKTIENMLLSKFEQWFKPSDMRKIWLFFKEWKNEKEFLNMPDPLFKYYLLVVILLLIFVFILENLTLAKWDWINSSPFYINLGFIIFFFIPLTWTHYFWTKYIGKSEIHRPTNTIINFFYNSSQYITNNAPVRFVIYTVLYLLFCTCVLTEWLSCNDTETSSQENKNMSIPVKRNFLLLVFNDCKFSTKRCVIPWHMTETFALAIVMSFMFLRMYMWLKLLYASIIASIYAFFIFYFNSRTDFFGDSQTYNPGLSSEISHTMAVYFLVTILHLVDRQTEYMNRIDHLWYKILTEKEDQANDLHVVNNMLLKNILPIHVADQYLNVNRHASDEVFHEYYDDTAVMFATITNFSVQEMGQGFLQFMSTVISEFDMVLVENTFGRPIEKIKIAKWTYMAACGLAPGRGNSENIRKDPNNHPTISLLRFAACLMQTLKQLNGEMGQSMKLRIGIGHGAIGAGVVGSKKPLYDIWGDPVNMASRMDTTGVADHIQVLESTKDIIESFGYVCIYRGQVKVKGINNGEPVSTYFVALNSDFELRRESDF